MIRRPTPEVHPNRWPFAFVELPVPREPEGLWCFKLPRWAVLAPLAKVIAEAATTGDAVAVDAAHGRVILLAWADQEFALEAPLDDGDAVFAELCDAAWPPSVTYALVHGLIERVSSEAALSKEVRERHDFFGVNGASHSSMSTGSASGTPAGTSSLSTD